MSTGAVRFTNRDPRSGFEKKLAAYALVGGAMLAMPDAASAGLIQVNLTKPIVLNTATGGAPLSYALDMDGDGIADFTFSTSSNHVVGPQGYQGVNSQVNVNGGANGVVYGYSQKAYTFAKAYSSPTIPGSGATFVNSASLLSSTLDGVYNAYAPFGEWPNDGSQRFLGVQFQHNGAATFGWIEVGAKIASADLILTGWAYDAPDSVPEPSSMALFAIGAAGVMAFRRRKSA